MSRFELGGHEEPNPIEALPNEFAADTPSYLVSLPNGEDFIPEVYLSFGYTHYEVTCIGGAGGSGGEVRDKVNFDATYKFETMPSVVWAAFIEVARGWYGSEVLVQDRLPGGGWGDSHYIPVATFLEQLYPGHQYQRATFSNPSLATPLAWGGGGGGGGLHVVSGQLADLPEAVPVVVGQAGVEGLMGHKISSATVVPLPRDVELGVGNVFWAWQSIYPLPHPSFPIPQPGGNGGTSSFNGDMCVASGGKGGKPAIRWQSGQLLLDGVGGEGGSGDRSIAGGGAPGATLLENFASDGTWDGEVGKGGGGGHGGAFATGFIWNALNNRWFSVGGISDTGKWQNAGDGGQGSFSYADTSVFGARQRKQSVSMQGGEPVLAHSGVGLIPIYAPSVVVAYPILAGGGGGATRGTWKFGSHALGFSPNGAVLIRVYKVD